MEDGIHAHIFPRPHLERSLNSSPFRRHLDTLRLLSVWGILRWRSNLKPNLENISLLPLSPCLQMGSEDFSANEGKGFKQRSFQTCRRTEGSYSVSTRDIFLVLLFPDLLESHLHGTLKDLQLELQEGMEISLQNASVASPDLENSKVFSLFLNANVLLTVSIEKRKTALHRIVEFQGFVFSILSEIIDIYLGLIG